MLAHTTRAWSARPSGTLPSGAIGTTPAVCSIFVVPSDTTAWAYAAAGGAIDVGVDLAVHDDTATRAATPVMRSTPAFSSSSPIRSNRPVYE